MKLISLYIDNFGKLSDFSFDFQKDINSIYEENGWGKTTLTVFIKAMLYGLSKQDRGLYTPWKNLSSFGGYLILEANGKEYRIERQFSPSKSSADTFKAYNLKTNQLVNINPNIGETLLNLNENSFERSVFIPQKDLNDGFGSDIEAKLANLIGGTNDSQTFDSAIEILKDKAKELKLNSKKGLIIDKRLELSQIEDEIEQCNRRMEGIPLIQANIDKINEEIDKLNLEKKEFNNKILDFTKVQDRRAKLEVVSKYEEDIALQKKLLDLNDYVFNGHDVSQEEVLNYRSKNKDLQNLKLQYEVKKSNNRATLKKEKLEKEINLAEMPDEETLEHITDQVVKYNNIKSVIASKSEVKEKVKPKMGITFTIISTVLIIVGVALFIVGFLMNHVMGLYIAGIAVSILAILGYLAALAGFISNNAKNNALQVGGQVKAYDYEKIHLEEEIREFFGKYHLYSSNFTNNLLTIRTNIQRYKDLQLDEEDITKENEALENQIHLLEEEIKNFLSQFNSSPSCISNEEKIGELNSHLRKHKELEELLAEKNDLLQTFISMNQLSAIPDSGESIEELNARIADVDAKIDTLNANKNTYLNKYSEYENEIAMYDEYIGHKEDVEIEIRRLEDEYRLLTLSMDYLAKSQTSLLEKYVAPMKESVNKYISLLLKDTDDYSIDVNFKFQFVTNNGLKSLESYSRGYQTIVALCMRLALVDCLYPNEKPFVILDDPFVNFDDEKLDLCKALIKAISKQYQIVYFTCHKSREIAQTKAPDALKEEVVRQAPILPKSISSSVSEVLGRGQAVELKPKAYHIDGTSATPVKPVVKPIKKSKEDELIDDLTKIDVQDVKPAPIRPVTKTNTLSGSPKPTSGRTIVINRTKDKK